MEFVIIAAGFLQTAMLAGFMWRLHPKGELHLSCDAPPELSGRELVRWHADQKRWHGLEAQKAAQ